MANGSHGAFMLGLHTSMVVAATTAVVGTMLALFVRRGQNSGAAIAVGD